MSRTDVAFGVQSGVREGLWLSCLKCRGAELAISDKKDHVSLWTIMVVV